MSNNLRAEEDRKPVIKAKKVKNAFKIKELKISKSYTKTVGGQKQGWPTEGSWCCTPWGGKH